MTMPTHPGRAFRRDACSPARRETPRAGPAGAHLGMIKRVGIGALTMAAAGGGVAAIMALKIVVYLPLITHH